MYPSENTLTPQRETSMTQREKGNQNTGRELADDDRLESGDMKNRMDSHERWQLEFNGRWVDNGVNGPKSQGASFLESVVIRIF